MENEGTVLTTLGNQQAVSPILTSTILQFPVFWDDMDMTWNETDITWNQGTDSIALTNVQI